MSRADRRRFEREFSKMSKPDNCMICGRALAHNSRTFGGLNALGNVVLAGECCERHVVTPMTTGIYLTRGVDGLLPRASGESWKGTAPIDIERAIGAIQSHFGDLDNRTKTLMQKGGISAQAQNIFVAEQPWKADDAAWFRNNPTRSHRLRPMLEGEAATLPPEIATADIPANHCLDILVRQVEPGARIRTVFCRNTEFVLPDREGVIHALFDTVAKFGKQGIIEAQTINDLAKKYANNSGDATSKQTLN